MRFRHGIELIDVDEGIARHSDEDVVVDDSDFHILCGVIFNCKGTKFSSEMQVLYRKSCIFILNSVKALAVTIIKRTFAQLFKRYLLAAMVELVDTRDLKSLDQ